MRVYRLETQIKINEREWIPQGTEITNVLAIAGKDSKTDLRVAGKLSAMYGGDPAGWKKQAGKVCSDKYEFDIHWYAHDKVGQFDYKIKNFKERRGANES